MTKISSNVEQQQSREAVKDFLAKELNNPELAKQTTEQIEKNPETMKQLQTIMEKNIKPIIEKGGTLPATPEGVKQAKMLIAYQILERKNINGYFPKKSDELINRASEVLKRLVNANNLDKKIWQTITIDNCTDTNQRSQIIKFEAEFTSGNTNIDTFVKSNPKLKKYLDYQTTHQNLSRLREMTGGRIESEWPHKQLNKEIAAKQETMKSPWEVFSNADEVNAFLQSLNKLSVDDLNSEWAFPLKEMMIDILQSSQDRTFSYRDLQNDNGVDYDHKNNTVSIKQPFIRSDNIQILSIWPEGIKMKNKITGQETILGKNTVQKAKEINDQRKADWKYREGKEKEIATKLGFYPVPEDISWEERHEMKQKVWTTLIKETFTTDQKLFESFHRESLEHSLFREDTKGEQVSSDFWTLFNEVLKAKGLTTNIDFSKGRNFLKAEMMNGQRVFILDTPDYKITIPFNGQLKVEQQPQMSHEEMNTPIKGQEKSPAYHRAEHAIENPDGNKVQLSNLWLNSKEITSLLTSHSEQLSKIPDLELNLRDNDITTFPTILFGMKTLKTLNLDYNRIKELPKNNSQKKIEIKKENCPNLQDISFNSNNLSTLPDEFLQLDQIKHLSMNNNRFSELPNDIAKLGNLESLQIRSNQLSKLPENITKLEHLNSLQATHCELTELPTNFNKLTNLIGLGVSENKLKTVPDISTLKQLQALYLDDNELTSLPPLWSLQELKYLSFEDNKNLTEIPNDIKTLPNLESEIRLSSNILSGEQMKNRFVDGEMSKQGYDFPDGANQFFTDGQQFKYTYAQAGSESEAINKAKSDIKLTETDQTFVMKKQLKNGEYSVVVFAKANGKEYYH